MYHPAYALRNPAVERESFDDVARIPDVLIASRARRAGGHGDDLVAGPDRALDASAEAPAPAPAMPDPAPAGPAAPAPAEPPVVMPPPLAADDDQLTIF
jgi:hypothetical protein